MRNFAPEISEERRVKSEEFKSRFPIKGHERKRLKSEEGLARRPKGKSMAVMLSNRRPREER